MSDRARIEAFLEMMSAERGASAAHRWVKKADYDPLASGVIAGWREEVDEECEAWEGLWSQEEDAQLRSDEKLEVLKVRP